MGEVLFCIYGICMRTILLIWVLFCFTVCNVFAQHEADNWYFGFNAGLSFKNGVPALLNDGQTETFEGCATISDKRTGALLFYTDGVKVWNRKHQIMKNGTGLKGGPSSSQSALIVPNPGDSLQYYIFTAPDLTGGGTSGPYAFFYSLVSLENPEGEVVSKNNLLIDNVSEKLTGTLDCSGKGFWVITSHVSEEIFYSYHVTSAGVNATPIISKFNHPIVNPSAGGMKISPNRTKLAVAHAFNSPCVVLLDFNAETGAVTNYKPLTEGLNFYSASFVSFSPDNSKFPI